MSLTLKSINQLDMAKTLIAAEIMPSSPDLRSWVAVYPKRPERGWDYYELRSFEIKKKLVYDYFGQEDLVNPKSCKAATINEVEKVLQEWGVVAEQLQAPWHSDYPL